MLFFRVLASTVVLTLLMCNNVYAWCDHGHLLATRIAYDILMEEAPEVIGQVEKILGYLTDADPEATSKE